MMILVLAVAMPAMAQDGQSRKDASPVDEEDLWAAHDSMINELETVLAEKKQELAQVEANLETAKTKAAEADEQRTQAVAALGEARYLQQTAATNLERARAMRSEVEAVTAVQDAYAAKLEALVERASNKVAEANASLTMFQEAANSAHEVATNMEAERLATQKELESTEEALKAARALLQDMKEELKKLREDSGNDGPE
ncbi:hypothetical protein KJ839_05320 [Patescibacteria group bacterium]|nr:hypothetical protein [Patescibacteria group bacterium]MBU1963606.1 hypothetical protein [Patescibacteria group bacterium]